MQKFIFFILLITVQNTVYANGLPPEWTTIYPLSNCPTLPIKYIVNSQGSYTVSFDVFSNNPVSEKQIQSKMTKKIADINDLSELTDYLILGSEHFCPSNNLNFQLNSVNDDAVPVCTEQPVFSEDYIDFIRFTAKYVNNSENQCDNIIPFIQFQEKIEQLNQEDLIQFSASKNVFHLILKTFLKDETDEMINQFSACGGKKGSSKFIQNMILLEAKNSCIIPNMLSWDEAKIIAKETADQHRNLNLIQLTKIQEKLNYQATIAFTDAVIKKEVDSLIGSYLYAGKDEDIRKEYVNEFVKDLDSYNSLSKFKPKSDIADYVSNVFSTDASLEIAEKALPIFISGSFSENLPEAWSNDKKENFIAEKLTPVAMEQYQKCIADKKEFSKYDSDLKSSDLLKHRLKQKDVYCGMHYPELNKDKKKKDEISCPIGCDGQVNLLTLKKDATDTEIIQGCVLQSVTVTLKPLLKGIIADQKEEFKENFNLEDKLATRISNKAWNTLVKCANKKITGISDKKYLRKDANKDTIVDALSANEIDFLSDETYLQKIKTDKFEEVLKDCSDLAEAKASTQFVTLLLLNEPQLAEVFSGGEMISHEDGELVFDETDELVDEKYPSDLINITNEIVNTSFKECLAKQFQLTHTSSKENGLKQKNTMLCTPIVEMNASLLVVRNELEELVSETEGLAEDEEIKKILATYEKCGDNAIDDALNDLGSLTSETPLNNVQDSKQYLDKNMDLFNCVETTISDVSYIVTGKEFDKVVEETKSSLSDPDYMESLKPELQNLVRACFKEGIKKQGNWSGFNKFNAEGGLDKLQKDCEMEASKFVVPSLIRHEAQLQLSPLKNDGFIEHQGQIGDILIGTANELKLELNIPKPSDPAIKGDKLINYYMGEALQIHLNKGGTQESFIDDIGKRIEDRTIIKVHKNLMSEITDYPKFKESFPASCLQDIYNNFMKETPTKPDEEPMSLSKLASYLQKGLNFSEKSNPSGFDSELRVLKNQCDNFDQFKTQEDFNKSQFYKIIIKAQIYEEFKIQFKKGVMDDLQMTEDNLTDPHKAIKKKYTQQMIKKMGPLLDKYLTEEEFNKNVFDDGKVIDFATTNLQGLLEDNKSTKEILSKKLLKKMFEKHGDSTFSDSFAQIQVEGNFGIGGVEEAYTEAGKGKSILWGLTSVGNSAGKKAALKYFNNPKNIKNAIDWKNIDEKERNEMTKSIFYDGILESQNDRSDLPKDMDHRVYGVIARSDAFVQKIFTGRPIFEDKIKEITDNATGNYASYSWKVESEAKKYAETLFLKYKPGTSKFTKKQLTDYIVQEVKKEHMERNVTNRLLKYEHKNGKAIEDILKDDITDNASDIFWGNTPEAHKARTQRAYERATSPWAIAPKW